jgi:hypothetical protein
MLLRRFTKHINEQNWFAVFLDLIIVVAGIIIGLQVNAWKSAQNDRVMERQYLERLLADMEVSVAAQAQLAEEDRFGIENVDALARSLNAGTLADNESHIAEVGLNYLGWVFQPVTNLVTVRELQSTGNISLIRSIEIRTALGQLELSYTNATYSAEQTSALLAGAQNVSSLWAYNEPAPDEKWGYKIRPDLDLMASTPGAGNMVSWFSAWMKYHSTWLAAHYEDTVALRDLIKATLAESNGK